MMLKYLHAPISIIYIYNNYSQLLWYKEQPAFQSTAFTATLLALKQNKLTF
jgi:hypothetical protein